MAIHRKLDNDTEVSAIVKNLGLQPHPEGGFYKQAFKSPHRVKSLDKNRYDDEERHAGSAIYYLLNRHDFSAWHRLKSDELWHHYSGSTVRIHIIDKEGNLSSYLLGDPLKNANATHQVHIPAGCWFSAENVNKTSYSLVGCTVTPAFEFKDFELANRESLSRTYPQHTDIINRLTRINTPEAQPENKITSRL